MGDVGVGKTSLISTYASAVFPSEAPHTLPPTTPPAERCPYPVPLQILDTRFNGDSSLSELENMKDNIARADVVLLLYDCGSVNSLKRLKKEWMQTYLAPAQQRLLRARLLEPRSTVVEYAQVVLVGCKLDTRVHKSGAAQGSSSNSESGMVSISHVDIERHIRPLMEEFPNVETCMECSAKMHVQVNDVFNYAVKAVLDPIVSSLICTRILPLATCV